MGYRRVILSSGLAVALVSVAACNQPATDQTAESDAREDAALEEAAVLEERDKAVTALEERLAELEREYADANAEVASGDAAASAGLREELKEDMQNVKQAVDELATTTPENWWDRHEDAVRQTADDIAEDVRRLAGSIPPAENEAEATTGTAAGAPFTSRRDEFVERMRARVESMQQALSDVDASGTKETEIEDTRARVDKLDEDLDRLASASAEDWWAISRARVNEYVERVEDSIGRLDDNEPDAP